MLFEVMINALALMVTLGLTFGSVMWKVYAKRPGPRARALIVSLLAPALFILYILMVAYITLKG